MNYRYVAMELVDTGRVSASDLEGLARIEPWCADHDVAESEAIGRRNRDICQRLAQYFPDARTGDDVDELDDFLEDDLPQEAVLRRLHRSRALRAPWRGGEIHIRLFDRNAEVFLSVVDLTRGERAGFESDLVACLRQLTAITGMQPRDALSGQLTTAEEAAASLLRKNARSLDALSTQVTRSRWRRRLGPPSIAILAILALALAFAIMAEAVRRGTLMLHVDPSLPQTFITESLPPPAYRLGLLPRFELDGRAGSNDGAIRLPVYRKEYLQAGPGAPYTVLPTFRPETPYVLRSDYESAGPILPLGSYGVAWFAVLSLLPLLLLYWVTVRPVLRAPAALRAERVGQASRQLFRLLLLVSVFLCVVWWKRTF